MSTAGQIMESSLRTTPIDGVDFVHRVYTTPIALAVLGSRTFNLLASLRKPEKQEAWNAIKEQEKQEIEKRIFQVMMVSPRVGDVDDADSDTISYETLKLSKYFHPLRLALWPRAQEGDEEDFSGASSEPTA